MREQVEMTTRAPLARILMHILICLAASGAECGDAGKAYLDNGVIRIGVDLDSGGSVFHFSHAPEHRNLLNHHDRGRFIQQSYYGDADGSMWAKQPWRWNPVQGGGYRGEPAVLLESRRTGTSIHTKSTPKHWATGADLPECVMESWITLDGEVARIRCRFAYSGDHAHEARQHEMPAVFVDHALPNLVFYRGEKPWSGGGLERIVPGWPNQAAHRDEEWAAYVDAHDHGIGVFTPGTKPMTCYRFEGPDGPEGGGCSYFAPLRTFAITKGTVVDYEMFLTIGVVSEIRRRFAAIHEQSRQAASETGR